MQPKPRLNFLPLAVEVDDAYKACEEVKKCGGKVTREAGPMKHGTTVIALIEIPTGIRLSSSRRAATNPQMPTAWLRTANGDDAAVSGVRNEPAFADLEDRAGAT